MKFTACNKKIVFQNTYYYVNDYIPEIEKFPPRLPFGTYKLDIQFFKDADRTVLFILKWYARVFPAKD